MSTEPEHVRVLQLVTRMNIGGPARHVLDLATSMPEDIRAEVAAGRPPAVEGELTHPEVSVHAVPLVRPVSPRQDLASVRAVRRLLRRLGTQVLHTHMAKAGTVGRVAARGLPIRTVHTFHGHVLSGYFSPPVQRAFLEAERRLARHTDVLIAVSAEIRDQLLDLGIGRPGQYEVIPVGVGSLTRAPERGRLRRHIGVAEGVPLAGVIARLAPVKDHATLFEALTQVDGLHLAVLGDGELRGELEALAARLGIADRVHFTGWWHHVETALVDLDLVVLTSRNEGTPVALLEAATMGLPVVATDVGGVRSVVEHGVTGLLAPPAAAPAIAHQLRQLVSDPGLAGRLGAAAGDRHAGIAGATEAFADLYRALSGPR